MSGRPLCVGKWELFDSRDPEDHVQASRICAACPVVDWCADLLAETAAAAHTKESGPQGTWAGELVSRGLKTARNPMRVAAEDAMFSFKQARTAHADWCRGDRSDRSRIGERVYQRKSKRRQKAQRSAA